MQLSIIVHKDTLKHIENQTYFSLVLMFLSYVLSFSGSLIALQYVRVFYMSSASAMHQHVHVIDVLFSIGRRKAVNLFLLSSYSS